MSSVTLVFESTYGQTRKIAEHIAQRVSEHGHEARLRHVSQVRASDVERANLMVLLVPVYNRKHAQRMEDFARAYHGVLVMRPTAFVSVSLV